MMVENLESRVLFSAGSLAHSFGSSGVITSPAGDNNELIAVQSNGEFIVAGSSSNPSTHGFLERYHSNGTPDPSFGTHGRIDLSATQFADVLSLTIARNGKIVIIGTDGNGNDVLAQLTSHGAFDPKFGTAGIAQLPGNPTSPVAKVAKDGTVVVSADYSLTMGGSPVGVFLRYSKFGKQDMTFGGSGYVANSAGAGYIAGDFFLYNNGDVEGLFYSPPMTETNMTTGVMSQVVFTALERFKKDGTLDFTFTQTSGENIPGGFTNRFVIDGFILSIGNLASGSTTAAIFSIAGGLYSLFGNSGKVTLPFPANAGTSVDRGIIEPGNKILIVEEGTTATTNQPYVALGGLTTKGKVNHAFGKTGVVQISPAQTVVTAAGDGPRVILLENPGESLQQQILAYNL